MIGNCPDYCNPQFHYDPHLQTKWKFEISTIIIIIIKYINYDLYPAYTGVSMRHYNNKMKTEIYKTRNKIVK